MLKEGEGGRRSSPWVKLEVQELSLTGQMARPSLPDLYPFLTEEKIRFSNQKSSRFTVKKSRNRKYAGKGGERESVS